MGRPADLRPRPVRGHARGSPGTGRHRVGPVRSRRAQLHRLRARADGAHADHRPSRPTARRRGRRQRDAAAGRHGREPPDRGRTHGRGGTNRLRWFGTARPGYDRRDGVECADAHPCRPRPAGQPGPGRARLHVGGDEGAPPCRVVRRGLRPDAGSRHPPPHGRGRRGRPPGCGTAAHDRDRARRGRLQQVRGARPRRHPGGEPERRDARRSRPQPPPARGAAPVRARRRAARRPRHRFGDVGWAHAPARARPRVHPGRDPAPGGAVRRPRRGAAAGRPQDRDVGGYGSSRRRVAGARRGRLDRAEQRGRAVVARRPRQ